MDINELRDMVSSHFGFDIASRRKTNELVFARSIFYDIAYRKLRLGSQEFVGSAVGNRDHATVIHALRYTFNDAIKNDKVGRVYRSILKELAIEEDFDANDTPEERLSKVLRSYADLQKKYNDLSKMTEALITDDPNDDRVELINKIKSVPEDKVPILKLRVDAIINMI